MQYIWVNGADEGQNKFIRVPPNNNPVTDVTSPDITCNVNGRSGAGVSTVSIPAGTNVRFLTGFVPALTTSLIVTLNLLDNFRVAPARSENWRRPHF